MRRYTLAVAAAALVLLTAGCGDSGTGSGPTAAEPEDTVSQSPTPSPEPGGSNTAGSGNVVRDAVSDLARRLGIEASSIEVVTAEEVTWRDGSMGCPRPGMMYTQSLTDGSRVVLAAQGKRYEYHAGGRRSAFLCENPQPPAGR